MTELLTESFCERCGTRYTFESVGRGKPLRGLRVLSKGFRNLVMTDDISLDEAMAVARSEERQAVTNRQLDAFHQTFEFCMSCRQYTCSDCWNRAESRCLSCAPVPAREEPGIHEAGVAGSIGDVATPASEAARRSTEVATHPAAFAAAPSEPAIEPSPAIEPPPAIEPSPAIERPAEPTIERPAEPTIEPPAEPTPTPEPATQPDWTPEPETTPEPSDEPEFAPPPVPEFVPAPPAEYRADGDTVATAQLADPVAAVLVPEPVPAPVQPIGVTAPGVERAADAELTPEELAEIEAATSRAAARRARASRAALPPVVEVSPPTVTAESAAPASQMPGLAAEMPAAAREMPAPAPQAPARAPQAPAPRPSTPPAQVPAPSPVPAPAARPAPRPTTGIGTSRTKPLPGWIQAAAGSGIWELSAREVLVRPEDAVRPCSSCSLPLAPTARFCRRCGTRQEQATA